VVVVEVAAVETNLYPSVHGDAAVVVEATALALTTVDMVGAVVALLKWKSLG
jgi:hypothetical protein